MEELEQLYPFLAKVPSLLPYYAKVAITFTPLLTK